MSGGWPGRVSFNELGGVFKDRTRVTDPTVQFGAERVNNLCWQVAGMNAVSAIVSLTVAEDGTRTSGREAWNMKDDPAMRVTVDHNATGEYTISAQASAYEDWSGTSRPVIFYGALITALSATSVRPPTYELLTATSIKVHTWNASGTATDMPFAIDIK